MELVECAKCQSNLELYFNFCPMCGSAVAKEPKEDSSKYSQRYLDVLSDYEKLIERKLTNEQVKKFMQFTEIGKLSVNSSHRRMLGGRLARVKNSENRYTLTLGDWLDRMYDVKTEEQTLSTRVWITTGGETFHANRDCKGLDDGQKYAQAKGKEIYKPLFITRKEAEWILAKRPCLICKPGHS